MPVLSPSPATRRADLSAVLVRLSRECGVGVEHLRADQLIREAQAAWPGEEAQQWSKWLLETSECLSLRAKVVELSMEDAVHLSEDGALLVGGYSAERGVHVLVGADKGHVELATGEIDDRLRVNHRDFQVQLESTDLAITPGVKPTMRWLVVEHPELSDARAARDLHHHPVRRLFRLLRPEWPEIWMILVFAFFAGVLTLATPIAVEALVNTVAFGRLLQPVLILAILLFGFLAFAAVMKAMQTYVAEVIQRRLFARVAADLAYRLPRTDPAGLNGCYGPELVNRFLDVVTLQKVVASLLLDGVSIVLATIVGMVVLGFYHPWLLGFDALLIVLVTFGLYVLGRGAISSGIDESKMKYRLTSWFEDLMRCQGAFKMEGGAEFAVDRANLLTTNYLATRRSHFGILFRQITFVLALQAIAGTVLLGAGGWLVIQGQLSLGQLVAAELIVTTILSSLAKLGKHLEGFYDLVAATDKLGALFDLKVERHDGLFGGIDADVINPADGKRPEKNAAGLEIELNHLRSPGGGWLSHQGMSEQIEPGERVAIYGPAGSGKTMLARMLYGLEAPAGGRLTIGGSPPRDLRPDLLRSSVALASEIELFEGTIVDNVHLRRASVGAYDVRAALEQVGLLDSLLELPDGLETRINASGGPLTSTQKTLLMIARALAGKPRLVILDGLLDSLPDINLATVVTGLMSASRWGTLLVMTGKSRVAERLDRTIYLMDDATPDDQLNDLNDDQQFNDGYNESPSRGGLS